MQCGRLPELIESQGYVCEALLHVAAARNAHTRVSRQL